MTCNSLEKGLENLRDSWCIAFMDSGVRIPNPSKLRGSKASPRLIILLGIVRLTEPTVSGIPIGICNLLQMKNFQLYEK